MSEEPLFDEFKRGIEAEEVGFDTSQLLNALHNDAEFFIQFNLNEELEFPVPGFHKDCWKLITTEMILYIALALPRGHAKTTLAKLACVWFLLFTDIRFIVYASNTHAIAADACKDIVEFMLKPNFQNVFGQLRFEIQRDNQGFYKFWLNVPDGLDEHGHPKFKEKYCIIKAIGAGQQVRGLNVDNERPQLAVVDDLEDDENTATPLGQKKVTKWFMGPFRKALSKKLHRIIFLGNMLSDKSLLYHLVVKSNQFHSMLYGCLLSNGLPLWPDIWTLEAIKEDFREYQQLGLIAQWFAEMMNTPIADGGNLISPDDIPYAVALVPGEQEAAFITVDPSSFSQKEWANDVAIVVHALRNGLWRVVDYVSMKMSPDQLYTLLVELCIKWRTRTVGIEASGYQQVLKVLFDVLAQHSKFSFDVYEVPHFNQRKTERLAAWCSLMRKKLWALTEGDFAVTGQLLAYDPSKTNNTDDLIDACAMGSVMTELYLDAIMTSFEMGSDLYQVDTGYAVCAN